MDASWNVVVVPPKKDVGQNYKQKNKSQIWICLTIVQLQVK